MQYRKRNPEALQIAGGHLERHTMESAGYTWLAEHLDLRFYKSMLGTTSRLAEGMDDSQSHSRGITWRRICESYSNSYSLWLSYPYGPCTEYIPFPRVEFLPMQQRQFNLVSQVLSVPLHL